MHAIEMQEADPVPARRVGPFASILQTVGDTPVVRINNIDRKSVV